MRNPLTQGGTAPDFAFKIKDGRILSLSSLRGRKVLLAFFRNGVCAMLQFAHKALDPAIRWLARARAGDYRGV